MHARLLIAALAAATLTAATSVSLYARLSSRHALPATKPIEPVIVTNGRIYLTAEQIGQTRNSALWPVEMRSLLKVDHQLQYGEWLWNDRGVPVGKPTIRIDVKQQLISVARGGHEIGTAVILYGADGHETPLGHFLIQAKDATYRSRAYDAPMPYAVRLTADGVSIHGSNVRWGSATHGCIGLPLEFARKLFDEVEKGDEVVILG